MQDEKQFEQLIMQYTQLKNGSEDISRMIDNEDFDNAITMIKNREHLFLSCKCIRKYLDLTPVQQKELDTLLDEIRDLELKNIKSRDNAVIFFHRLFFMTAPKYIFSAFYSFQMELKKSQQSQKFQKAYDFDANYSGNIINIQE